ncbi:gamma-glutamyl kinase [Paroceanicella profunda]|uniref:Gamma-glutamyl kinase n=1 Tax=Paroceanicella profunda TaxID=2579971 RepID=A0A5B8G0A8_9RHOB|nr:gamma-glutamyl kinase [Paroceanicella profunda]QDL92479.1 gamma-glutamyl kinase [Paroceanicella profunda]
MMICPQARLAFFSMPKTGSSAVLLALRPHAPIQFSAPPQVKHMTLVQYERHVAPLLRDCGQPQMETVCLVREPVDWLRSWYAFRSRDVLRNTGRSTAGISFAQFVEDFIAPVRPPHAVLPPQSEIARRADGRVGIDHIFRYDTFGNFAEWLSDRLGEKLEFERRNVSPVVEDRELPAALRARLEQALAADFSLYADHAR